MRTLAPSPGHSRTTFRGGMNRTTFGGGIARDRLFHSRNAGWCLALARSFCYFIRGGSNRLKFWATRSFRAATASMVPIEHFCCQNSDCPQAGVRGGGNLYFRGWSGKGRRIRMVYCRSCKRSSSERKATVLEHARLPDDKALDILKHLREGCGTRATGRLVEVDKNTGRFPKSGDDMAG